MRQASTGIPPVLPRLPDSRILAAIALIGVLAGCQSVSGPETGDPATGSAAEAEASGAGGPGRDVEAPEVFETRAEALWDGRPSLGGTWVAAPGVTQPERVRITNSGTGKSVVGALFKRERDNPGPPLQLSSEAAGALGILAGTPTPVDVVALREGTPPPVGETPAGEAVAAAGTSAPAETPRRRGLLGRLFGRDRPAAPAAAAAGAPAPARPEVTATTLDAPDQSPVESPAESAAAPAGPLDRAFVQIASFSVETNARDAVAALRDTGVAATAEPSGGAGAPVWRVVAGPAATEAERTAIIRKAGDLGFTDAFAVAG